MNALLLPLTLSLACNKEPAPEVAAIASPADAALSSVRSVMDAGADPCQDFYQYACGAWLRETQMPSDQARWDRGFSTIEEQNREVLREILEAAAADPTAGDDDWRRMGNYYASCMNEGAINAAGLSPIQSYLTEIDEISDKEGLFRAAAHLSVIDAGPFFGMGPEADFKNPDMNVLFMSQGGLGLPERDYYLSQEPDKVELRAAYEKHLARMLSLTGVKDAEAAAKGVLAFETSLAEISLPVVELYDPEKIYNKIDRAGLKKAAPDLPWDTYFAEMGAPDVPDLVVTSEPYFSGLNALLKSADMNTIKLYLRWGLINSVAGLLSDELSDADFDFYGRTLRGQPEREARWKRCSDAAQFELGEIVGRYFVERRFAGASKDEAVKMIQGIEGALEAALPGLSWMDEATRARAKEKLDAVTNKIGYPDVWRDYSSLGLLSPTDHFGNARAVDQFELSRAMKKVGQPVDRTEWMMPTPMVNAYYNPLGNEIVFPAGILQPPFFSAEFPPVMNFGGIGMIVGHEVTHGFDNDGRKFDPRGQMVEWWAPEVSARFEEAAQCVADQYSAIEVLPGVKLNGELTLGENIADIGGLKESFSAWKSYEAAMSPAPLPADAGFTNDQLFFLSFAQSWCSLSTPEMARIMAATDPHSPPKYRVNAALTNVPAFAEAFSCSTGTPMAPEKTCTVW